VLDVTAGIVGECFLLAGSEAQKRTYLPAFCRAEKLAAFCLSEPGSGSDAAALRTRAVRQGDHFVLNGTKTFITNGGVADVYLVLARTDPAKGARGISAFLVEKGTSGLSFSPPFEKMGLHASQTCQVILEDCRVPAENLLGPEGEGFTLAMRALDSARAAVSAQAIGIAQGALDYALEYTKQREAFGQPVIGNQGIQFLFADMAAQLAAARALAYQAAWMFDVGHPERAKYGAMAKLFCTETAAKIVGDAVVMLGGYGYMREYPMEKMYRDVKALQIYEGSNHIQRVVIARHLLGGR
jgi:butyryl-CoA dehydrogenase